MSISAILAFFLQLLPLILKMAKVKEEDQAVVIKLVPAAVTLVGVAEKAFEDVPKSGALKAGMVNTALQAIVEGGQAVATGGAKATWTEIAPVVQQTVKLVADVAFNPDLFKKEPEFTGM